MLSDAAVAALSASTQPFSFFPPVRNFEENHWRFQKATRVEFSALHVPSNQVLWFPRSAVNYITVEDSGVTVTLARELKAEHGGVWPVRMGAGELETGNEEAAEVQPVAVAVAERDEAPPPPPRRAAQKKWTFEPVTMVLASAVVAAGALVFALLVARGVLQPSRGDGGAPIGDSRLFTLTRDDNYHDVVRKLGAPGNEHPLSLAGSDLFQRALVYGDRNYAVVLLGEGAQTDAGQQNLRFIGAVRLSDGAVVSSVSLGGGSSSDPLLRQAARQLTEK